MKGKKIAILVVAVLFLVQGLALAEAINGKVSKVNVETKQVTINVTDAATGTTSEKTVTVGDTTQYVGVASLADLKADDEVKVSAEADATSQELKAASVEVVKAEAAPTM